MAGKLLGDTLSLPTVFHFQVCIKYSLILNEASLCKKNSTYYNMLTCTSNICFNISKLHKKDNFCRLAISRSNPILLTLFGYYMLSR